MPSSLSKLRAIGGWVAWRVLALYRGEEVLSCFSSTTCKQPDEDKGKAEPPLGGGGIFVDAAFALPRPAVGSCDLLLSKVSRMRYFSCL
jgi:hypothetical protein